MSYIGNTPTNQNFVAGSDQFNGTGSQTVFTLSRNVNTVNDIQVVVSNVPQDPFTAYSVSGNSLTFTSAPPAGTGNVYVVYRATNVQTFVPSPGATVGGSFGIQGNLNFFGTGNRITGDFSNATVANRVAFQNSVTNAATNLQAIPNGTSLIAGYVAYNNSDPTNASIAQLRAQSDQVVVNSGITGTGTYLPMTFYTGGSERMRIDTSGNVGIGTSSPNGKLGVVTTQNYAGLDVRDSNYYLQVTPSSLGGMALVTGNNPVIYYINGSERARIDSSGNFMVGTASPTAKFTVSQSANSPASDFYTSGGAVGTPCMYVKKQPNDGSTSQVYIQFLFNNASSGNGQINGNGSGAAAFGSYSDERLKENIVDLPPQLENICALRPVEFDYKTGGHQVGFIAQEMQEVYPDVVGTASDEMLTITGWSKTEARLVKAIQEQQQMIEILQAEVAALKGAA